MGWVVNATPRPFYPRERPGTNCTGGWVGPRAGLDGCGKSRPHRQSIPGRSSLCRVAIPAELSRPVRCNVSEKFKICECWSCNINPYSEGFASSLTLLLDREADGGLQLPDVKGRHCILADRRNWNRVTGEPQTLLASHNAGTLNVNTYWFVYYRRPDKSLSKSRERKCFHISLRHFP